MSITPTSTGISGVAATSNTAPAPEVSTSGPVRIGNFYSSFDTDAVIAQLTAAAQIPITQINTQEAQINQQNDAVTAIQTQFATLLSRANTLMDPASVSAKSATVDGDGVSAAATPDAVPGSFTIAVTQIATGTSTTGTALTGALDASSMLNASNFGTPVTAGTFTIKTAQGSATITVDPATQSLNDVLAAINAQTGTTGVTASITTDANGKSILHLDGGSAGAIQLGNGADTSNFLAATNLLASPGTTTRDSTLPVARINLASTMATASFAGGAPASGAHSFTINGVQINYDASSDSLSTVINRINTSAAGVKATYDAVTDKLTLTQSKLGSIGIQLADDGTGGNFLATTGLLASSQTLGQNAQYSINGGPAQYSATNAISVGNGVTVTLTAPTGATPATVTIGADETSAVTNINNFVTDFNALMTGLASATKADKDSPGPLSGDSDLISLMSSLRSMMSDVGTNVTGSYNILASIGLSFGPIGSAVGTTDTLVFDQDTFNAAVQNDPLSVQNALSQFTLSASLAPGGTGSVTGISGSYVGTIPGSYKITDDGAGNLTSVFSPADGSAPITSLGTVTANGTNKSLIPGITLQAGALSAGTVTINAPVSSESVIGKLRDFLNGIAGSNGTLKNRTDEYTNDIKDMEARKVQLQASIDAQVAIWQQKFTQMEEAEAQASTISQGLTQAFAPKPTN
ncbi:MAG: flagellar filament capping protein FliD [Tepidiformaceae bacterium]